MLHLIDAGEFIFVALSLNGYSHFPAGIANGNVFAASMCPVKVVMIEWWPARLLRLSGKAQTLAQQRKFV